MKGFVTGSSPLRLVAAAALATTLLLGSTACTLSAIQGTRVQYQPSDGIGATIGDLKLRNVIGLSENGDDISLLLTIVNTGDRALEVNFQYTDADGVRQTLSVEVAAHSSLHVGDGDTVLVLRNAGVAVGGSVDVFAEYEGEPGKQLHVPVLTGETEAYSDLIPEPLPSVTADPEPSPEPTETAVG